MSLEVHFTGICTHLPSTGGAHRVVLVRADNGAYLNDSKLPPHIPMLRIDPDHIKGIDGAMHGLLQTGPGAWRLCGVQLTLEGTTEETLSLDDEFGAKVPHLGVPNDGRPKPDLSGAVLSNGEAACYVDLFAGRLKPTITEHKAIMSRLDVETNATPALKVTCFWNRKESTIHLVDGARIDIEHVGMQDGDSADDFLFHYRVFEWVDEDAFVPKEPKAGFARNSGSTSIGCSNSQYP